MTGRGWRTISTPMLIDSHCHLDHPGLSERRDEALSAARARDIGRFLNIATAEAEWDAVCGTAVAHEDVFAALGVHPHHADDHAHIDADALIAAAARPRVIALGESGLDYHYDRSGRDRQRASFRSHIAAARTTGLPLIIHTRDAEKDTDAMLTDELARGPFKALIHCFTGTPEFGRRMLELGLTISFSGVVTFKNADGLRAFAAEVPAGRMMVETDAPFLAPVPHRGKPGEPAMVADTAEALAAVRGESFADLAAHTTEQFFHLFSEAS